MINVTCVPLRGGALTDGSLAARVQFPLPPRLFRCLPDASCGCTSGRRSVPQSCSDAAMLVDLLLAQARRAGRGDGSAPPLPSYLEGKSEFHIPGQRRRAPHGEPGLLQKRLLQVTTGIPGHGQTCPPPCRCATATGVKNAR